MDIAAQNLTRRGIAVVLLLLAFLLAGCQPKVYLMPTPVAFSKVN